MSTPCDSLQAFADGELPPAEAQAFGQHLAGCERCQSELTQLLQLEELGRGYLERHGPVEVPWYATARTRWAGAGVAVVLSVLALVLFVLPRFTGGSTSQARPELWAQQQRTLEARVTYPEADAYRPMAQRLMGSESALGTTSAPHTVMSDLEKRGDLRQLAAAYLASGTPDVSRAQQSLAQLRRERPDDANIQCDLGVAHYVVAQFKQNSERTGELREALSLFNEVLAKAPTHVQALWNRALVYRDLGLPLLAMQDLAAVERTEPDARWRNEAQEKRKRLEEVLQRRSRWKAAEAAGGALIEKGTTALPEALQYTDIPLMRRDFYHAVRARTSAAQVLEFLPLASRLDERAKSGRVLQEYVERVAARNFSVRAPLAAQYARLIAGQVASSDEESVLRTFLASEEKDLALGALTISVRRFPQYTDRLLEFARASEDPWFQVIGLQKKAALEQQRDDYKLARDLLEEALDLCKRKQLGYRWADVENDLSHAYGWLSDVNEAERHARAGLILARRSQWDQERMLLQTLGNVMRKAADYTLGRAYFGEALLMAEGDRTSLRNIHQDLAHLAIWALELDEARTELNRALEVGLPLTQHGIEALVDVARTRPSSRDAQAVEEALSREPGTTPGQRAYAKFLRGRFQLEVDPHKGRALLEEAIHEAQPAISEDVTAKHARTYSYTSLIFADAKEGNFAAALDRFGSELGMNSTGRCVLALTEDTERSLLVARGADGRLVSSYAANRSARFDPVNLKNAVPPDMVDALRPCATVDVLARPPLQGRSGLLPPEFAWRYLTRSTPPQATAGRRLHLVVSEVRYKEQRNDPFLTWSPSIAPGAEVRTLRDLEATPGEVLEAMGAATDIDFATHGKIDSGSNTAYLLLAPGPGGDDELNAKSIQQTKLSGAPLVVLAACEAARGSSALHEQDSLPNALLTAGARTVLAATVSIPNDDASAFFAAVRERIRAGAPASVAARDERVKWLNNKEGAGWVNGVLVFE